MRFAYLLVFLSFYSFAFGSRSTTISNASAINISGKQRMLSQRIAKCYIYEYINENFATANREKGKSILLFEENLRLLKIYAASTEVSKKLQIVEYTWNTYKSLVESQNSRKNVEEVMSMNSLILKECNDVVIAIKKSILSKNSDTNIDADLAETINISGRQRMLSQRFSLYYTAFYGSVTNDVDLENLKVAYKEFDLALSLLIINPMNTSEIDSELMDVLQLWKKVRDNYQGFLKKKIPPTQVYDDFNLIMVHMNKVTNYYAKLKSL